MEKSSLSENNVTISLISTFFEQLRNHLSPHQHDTPLITNMKSKMLIKLNSRYTPEQMKILKTCTLLDVRYKSNKYLALEFNQLEADVKHILEDQKEQSQPQP